MTDRGAGIKELKEIGMGYSYVLNCVNCGKQNLMLADDPYNARCEFGNHPVRIKEVNMAIIQKIKASNSDVTGDLRGLPPVPPKPDVSGMIRYQARQALSKYYKEHDEEMLADFNRLGSRKTRKRWGCSSSFWRNFRLKHGLPIAERIIVKIKKESPAPAAMPKPTPKIEKVDQSKPESTAVKEGNLPAKFPAFNEAWSDAVKAVWLKSYVELYRIEWAREPRRKENWLLKILCWWRW